MKRLPEYFAIERDENNTLWGKFEDWVQVNRHYVFNVGNYIVPSYCPLEKIKGCNFKFLELSPRARIVRCEVITLEEWDRLVNGFKLPKKWKIKNCKEAVDYVKNNLNLDVAPYREEYKNEYLCVDTNKKGFESYHFYPRGYADFNDYTEITLKQFKRYVLKRYFEGGFDVIWTTDEYGSPIELRAEHDPILDGPLEPKSADLMDFQAPEVSLVVSPLVGEEENLSSFNKWSKDTYGGNSILDEVRSYTWNPGERYFAGIDTCNGSDSSDVNIFTNPLTTDECFKKVYTIEDLSEGRVAVINDGTKEELNTVLKAAFPDDNNKQGLDATYFEMSSFVPHRWTSYNSNPHSNTQSVKEFYKQIKTEKMDNRFPFKLGQKDAKRIVDIACSSWKPKLAEKWGTKLLEKGYVEIQESDYKVMRKACTNDQNKLFDEIFGSEEEQFSVGDWVTNTNSDWAKGECSTFKVKRTKGMYLYVEWEKHPTANDFKSNFRKATPKEIAKAQCPYEDGELCWVSDGSPMHKKWCLRYATGKVCQDGPTFYADQQKFGWGSVWKHHRSAKGVEIPKD